MAIKKFKPTTPSRRYLQVADFAEITRSTPEKSLLEPQKKKGGRNFQGRITVEHRGGGHKRRYRVIDFKRNKDVVPAKVASIEYDPNRSARIALLHYRDGEKRYILAPKDLQVGDEIVSGEEVEPKCGNCMALRNMPVGIAIHNIELFKGRGGVMVRSAGSMASVTAKEGNYAHVLLPSGAVHMVHLDCRATVGQLGNLDHANIVRGKAGRTRWLGRRPVVRGVAMNPVAHPMGGGEGRSGGGRHPCSKTGRLSKGGKTRRRKLQSDRFIVRKRRKK